jgi:hypothetical protein
MEIISWLNSHHLAKSIRILLPANVASTKKTIPADSIISYPATERGFPARTALFRVFPPQPPPEAAW